MIKQRLYTKELYENPIFKSKFWRDENVYNENTPLLKKNINDSLNKHTKFSQCYEDFEEYEHYCHNKNYPQVVGVNGNTWNHWLAVIQENNKYIIIDSSGAPKDCYYRDEVDWFPPRNQVITKYSGEIRQCPLANSCGIWALSYCVSNELFPANPLWIWDQCVTKIAKFNSEMCSEWIYVYSHPETEWDLYPNDINIYNYYVNHLK